MKGKRERVKSKKSTLFQITLKSGEEFWPFNAFAMIKIRFSNHRLIEVSKIYVYIKPELKKNDAVSVTTAIICIEWLHENC